jgi:hypothetical protein
MKEDIPTLEFVRTAPPYQDVFLYFGYDRERGIRNALRGFCDEESFSFFEFGYNADKTGKDCFIVSTRSVGVKNGVDYHFSGMAKAEKKDGRAARLVLGDAELAEDPNMMPEDIVDSVGEFLLVLAKPNGNVELHTDYFSQMKLVYYLCGDVFAVASSYHFLLIALKRLGVPLRVNLAAARLEFVHLTEIFQRKLTRESDLENVFFLPINKRVVLAENKVLFHNTSIYGDMVAPPRYSEEAYEEMIYKVRDELVENAETVMKHPKFKHVVCDITGGIDSRIALAALTNVPDPERKLALSSIDGSHVPANDLKTAIAISKATGIPFDTAPTRVEILNSLKHFSKAYSLYLGTYYLFGNMAYSDTKNDEYIRVGGRYCEAFRRYVLRAYKDHECSDGDAVLNDIGKYHGNGTVNVSPGGELLADVFLEKELDETPGLDFENKTEHLVLNVGRSFHFANRTYSRYLCTNFNVGVSKKAYTLRQMCWGGVPKSQSLKLQMDTLAVLNPLLAVLAFGNEDYNKFRKEKKESWKLGMMDLIELDADRSDFDAAAKLRKSRETRTENTDAPVTPEQVYAFELKALQYIADYEIDGEKPFRDSVAFPCFRYLKTYHNTEKAVPMYMNVLKSKILSLYYILNDAAQSLPLGMGPTD